MTRPMLGLQTHVDTFLKNLIMRLLFSLLLSLAALAASAQIPPILVSSNGNNSVKGYDSTGASVGDFIASGEGGLVNPQEILFHPDGFVLVTGFGNSAVKAYNPDGSFLGDFTSGYSLINPSKTTLGPDSLLYISQWSSVQNKVVRFDFRSGDFVDEFTASGLVNGMGHAWDSLGNLYVAAWGDGSTGTVEAFGPDGSYLGTRINSSMLQGPVNLWIDNSNKLWVVDWTLGCVFRYQLDGTLIDTLVSGLSRVEGFDFDDEGRFYLCDWLDNRVYRFDFGLGTTELFIATGGLDEPNDFAFRPAAEDTVTSGLAPAPARADLTLLPSLGNGHLMVQVPEKGSLQWFDLRGQLLGQQAVEPGWRGLETGLAAGHYIMLWQGARHNTRARFTVR